MASNRVSHTVGCLGLSVTAVATDFFMVLSILKAFELIEIPWSWCLIPGGIAFAAMALVVILAYNE